MLKEIDVYDNKALGICLWHTEDMDKRLLEPFRNGEAIGEKTGEIKLIDKLTKNLEDNRAVKDPKEFEKWMRDHGMDKKG